MIEPKPARWTARSSISAIQVAKLKGAAAAIRNSNISGRRQQVGIMPRLPCSRNSAMGRFQSGVGSANLAFRGSTVSQPSIGQPRRDKV